MKYWLFLYILTRAEQQNSNDKTIKNSKSLSIILQIDHKYKMKWKLDLLMDLTLFTQIKKVF